MVSGRGGVSRVTPSHLSSCHGAQSPLDPNPQRCLICCRSLKLFLKNPLMFCSPFVLCPVKGSSKCSTKVHPLLLPWSPPCLGTVPLSQLLPERCHHTLLPGKSKPHPVLQGLPQFMGIPDFCLLHPGAPRCQPAPGILPSQSSGLAGEKGNTHGPSCASAWGGGRLRLLQAPGGGAGISPAGNGPG